MRLVSPFVILPYLLINSGVEQARLGAQVRLEGRHEVVLLKLQDRIVRLRILKVSEDTGLGGANFNTRRLEASRNTVVAQRAFLRRLGHGAEEPAAVRAGLDAKAAADAVLRIDQDRPVRRVERRP